MTTSSLFSGPVALILNKRLISQRGGIVAPAQQSEDSLRFKLFINSNPSSVRYGLTLQISALRDMSKEHNIDQIPEYQAYIFIPTKSFFQYTCMTPRQTEIHKDDFEGKGIDVEQARDIDRMAKTFWIKDSADFDELRHLRVCCWNASVDKTSLPKLRNEGLESELKRIFGTVQTANEIDNACLEFHCLLSTMKGETDKAVWAMYDAAQKNLGAREAKERSSLKKLSAPGGESQKSRRPNTADSKSDAAREKSTCKERTPKKFAVPAIIDGKFVSPENSFSRRENRQITNSTGTTPTTSPNKYLHPHTFDNDVEHFEPSHDRTFDSQDTAPVEANGSLRENWRADH